MFGWLFGGGNDSGPDSEPIDVSQLSDGDLAHMTERLEAGWDSSRDNPGRQAVIRDRLDDYYNEARRR